jgi:intein/homing endonuclease
MCEDYARKCKGEWIPSNDLKKEDYIGVSFPSKVVDVESIRLSEYLDKRKVGRWHVFPYVIKEKTICTRFNPTHNLPRDVNITPEFMRLIGYYLAEGSGNKRNKYQFTLSFNRSERKYIEDVCLLFNRIFGLEPKLATKESVVEIRINSVILYEFFTKLCGDRASNKHLPQWMLFLPKQKQVELIKGFVNGDGHRGKKNIMLSTISLVLAYQLRQILFRLGIINSIRQEKQRGGTIKGRKIKVQKNIYVLMWSKNQPKFAFIKDGVFWMRIREIEKEPYNGLVYNLEVDVDNSYTTVGGTLHNCTYPAPYTMAWQEALMTGIPTVNIGLNLAGFNTFEVPYLIENGVNGFVSDSILELRRAVSALLEDHGLAKRISEKGRELALSLFDKGKIKEQWRAFFESLQ